MAIVFSVQVNEIFEADTIDFSFLVSSFLHLSYNPLKLTCDPLIVQAVTGLLHTTKTMTRSDKDRSG